MSEKVEITGIVGAVSYSGIGIENGGVDGKTKVRVSSKDDVLQEFELGTHVKVTIEKVEDLEQ